MSEVDYCGEMKYIGRPYYKFNFAFMLMPYDIMLYRNHISESKVI
jgi:hypothetical protein